MRHLDALANARGLIHTRGLTPADRRAVERATDRGTLVRLARGSFLAGSTWAALDHDARYRARLHAVATALADGDLLSDVSALALWRLPAISAWPTTVHCVGPRHDWGRRAGVLVRHTTTRPDPGAVIDGLPVTSLARTVIDTAAREPLAAGLMAADAALRGLDGPWFSRPAISRDDLLREAERVPVRRGRSRALLVAKLADARAESAGESLLRASIHLLGLPMPELQREFRGDSERRYSVDCYWPDQQFVLEFDGRAKYLDPALRGGRSAEQVVVDEKEREDEIRPQVRGMARVGWSVAAAPWRLEARLRAAGFRFPPRR